MELCGNIPGRGKKTERLRECIRLCFRALACEGAPPDSDLCTSSAGLLGGNENSFGVVAVEDEDESDHGRVKLLDNGDGGGGERVYDPESVLECPEFDGIDIEALRAWPWCAALFEKLVLYGPAEGG